MDTDVVVWLSSPKSSTVLCSSPSPTPTPTPTPAPGMLASAGEGSWKEPLLTPELTGRRGASKALALFFMPLRSGSYPSPADERKMVWEGSVTSSEVESTTKAERILNDTVLLCTIRLSKGASGHICNPIKTDNSIIKQWVCIIFRGGHPSTHPVLKADTLLEVRRVGESWEPHFLPQQPALLSDVWNDGVGTGLIVQFLSHMTPRVWEALDCWYQAAPRSADSSDSVHCRRVQAVSRPKPWATCFSFSSAS